MWSVGKTVAVVMSHSLVASNDEVPCLSCKTNQVYLDYSVYETMAKGISVNKL